MAKLARKTQKVFASGATNNGQFGSAQLGTKVLSNDLDVLQALDAFLEGWLDGIIGAKRFPTLEEFQALNYIDTYQLAYLFQEGIPEWDTNTNYFTRSIVKKTGTYQLYGSKIDNNQGNALPVAVSDDNWLYLQDLSAPPTVEPASETVAGIIRIATTAEAAAGTDDTIALSPLHFLGTAAAEAQKGTARVATQTEANAGTDDATIVTPKKLIACKATESQFGVAENATAAEALALVNDQHFITPAKLALVLATLAQVPTGTVQSFAGSAAPSGWLLCFGQAISRTTYASLYAVTGNTYGAGDGSTTFNLPDCRGRLSAGKDNMGGVAAGRLTGQTDGVAGTTLGAVGGEETHTLITAEMPEHDHTFNVTSNNVWGNNGKGGNPAGTNSVNGPISASTNSAGGDGPHNNVQPTIIFNSIIKI